VKKRHQLRSRERGPVGKRMGFSPGTGGARNAPAAIHHQPLPRQGQQRIERVALIRARSSEPDTTNAALNPRLGADRGLLFGSPLRQLTEPGVPEAKLTGGADRRRVMGIRCRPESSRPDSAIFLSDGSAWFGGSFPIYGPGRE